MPDIRVSGILVREGRIVLVRRQGSSAWELPGGPLEDRDETTESSLVRHLLRLLGVTSGEPEFVDTLYRRDPSGGWALENLFLVHQWSGLPANHAPAELAEVTTYELSAVGYLEMDDDVRRTVQGVLGLGPPLSAGVATKVIIVTGPPGAGKSTVAGKLCERLERAAHVDVDTLRHMVVAGHASPVTPEDPVELARQLGLAVRNAADLARNFVREGFHVVIDDVVFEQRLQEYADALAEVPADLYFVLLQPPLEELRRRDQGRPEERRLGPRAEELWRAFQEASALPGLRLDTAGQTPAETADAVMSRLREATLERRHAW